MRRRDMIVGSLALVPCRAASRSSAEIFASVRAGDVAAVARRLEADPELIKARNASGETPLLAAAYHRNGVLFVRPEDNRVFQLIASKVREPDLFEACVLKRRDIVAAALDADSAIARSSTANGRTPLHYAAYVGDVPLIDLLLDRGALIDVAAAGVFGSPPILQAILGHRLGALERLIARGANVNVRLSDGSTPMHEAGLTGQNAVVSALARAGALPDVVRADGWRPRDLALSEGHGATAALLDRIAADTAGAAR